MVRAAMLGVFLFIGFWVLVGLTIFVIALSGGPREARTRVFQSQSRRGRRTTVVVILIVCLAFGVALPALVIANDEHQDKAGRADVKLTASQKRGRELFGHTCNQCHTLAASKTVGKVGPNLDNLRPPEALVLNAIQQGRARGNGRMPAALLQGQDAQDVAAYVSKVAGRQ
jgi:mono/diheme cytochrome c family protein